MLPHHRRARDLSFALFRKPRSLPVNGGTCRGRRSRSTRKRAAHLIVRLSAKMYVLKRPANLVLIATGEKIYFGKVYGCGIRS